MSQMRWLNISFSRLKQTYPRLQWTHDQRPNQRMLACNFADWNRLNSGILSKGRLQSSRIGTRLSPGEVFASVESSHDGVVKRLSPPLSRRQKEKVSHCPSSSFNDDTLSKFSEQSFWIAVLASILPWRVLYLVIVTLRYIFFHLCFCWHRKQIVDK